MDGSEDSGSVRRLDILAQVALEVEEKRIIPKSLIREEGVSTQKVIRRSRRKRNIG